MASKIFVKLVSLLTLFSALTTSNPVSSSASRRHHTLEDIQKRQSDFFSVLGVAGITRTEVHPRKEIRELEKDADQWNVYLLALRRFQSVRQNDKLSYYQICGIHGRPFVSWDGVSQGDGGFGGYCAHTSNLFLSWHRPYLALFEEVLYLNAREAISEFPAGELRDRYNIALTTFRMPYWDWAAVPPSGQGSLPWSLQRPTIDITLPKGTVNVPNPLFSYTFHPLPKSDFGSNEFSIWPSTLRDPSSKTSNATSRNDIIALVLDGNRANMQSRVYGILAMQHEYTQISSDLAPGDSLESLHDTIHNSVGGSGHMSILAYSAFDPIFMLHHANVDRLFAIWQALNPNSYVTPRKSPYATFTYKPGFVSDVNTPLTPFHRDDAGNFWTSESCRSASIFAYTYPELVGIGRNDTLTLVARVNALYGPNAVPPKKRDNEDEIVDRSSLLSPGVAGAPTFSSERQYVANIKACKFGLDGSFNVYVFLGGDKPRSSSGIWTQDTSFVGVTGILSQPGATNESNGNQEVNGAVPLTAALEARVRNGELKSMKEDVVERYLQQNLRWQISKAQEIAVAHVPGFQISVLWAQVKPAAWASEFPTLRGEYRVLIDATNGQPGGFGYGDTLL
ncbi:Di-copper centre-containing protein [Pleomassaria siparia CBS 279.74]|uniref:tyrosinase n=1 Tax=Pleomassaria siparia CBS 279.74 TaxID=1314801 RepID=A0A6G1KF51_9PLEO|nr:Di-copper centre-containing protein [Pleomassaria siparia CBS 279.74]